jgi:large conductance mechanosensitive channel
MATKHVHGFMDFMREQGVIGLAVGFLVGGAVSKLVTAFITDVINPLLGLVLGLAGDFGSAKIAVGESEILIGHFIATLVDFIIIAAVVYFGVRMLKLDRLDKKKQ